MLGAQAQSVFPHYVRSVCLSHRSAITGVCALKEIRWHHYGVLPLSEGDHKPLECFTARHLHGQLVDAIRDTHQGVWGGCTTCIHRLGCVLVAVVRRRSVGEGMGFYLKASSRSLKELVPPKPWVP